MSGNFPESASRWPSAIAPSGSSAGCQSFAAAAVIGEREARAGAASPARNRRRSTMDPSGVQEKANQANSIFRVYCLVGNDRQPSRGTIHNVGIVAAWISTVVEKIAWLSRNVVFRTPLRVPDIGIVEPRRGEQRGADEKERAAVKSARRLRRVQLAQASSKRRAPRRPQPRGLSWEPPNRFL